MIVEFSVKNFRSINELQTVSFVTSALKSSQENEYVDLNNIAQVGETKLFKTIGVYGPNGSGKSNIIKALDNFIKVLVSQPSSVSNLRELCQPFLFQDNEVETESFFQIVILVKNVKYRYGLTVKVNSEQSGLSPDKSSEIVTNEWLYSDKKGKSSILFLREGTQILKNSLQSKTKIPTNLPFKHTLFLTYSSAFDTNGDCYFITDHLRRLVTSNFEVNHDKFRWMSVNQMQDDDEKNRFIKLLSSFNLSYDDVFLEDDINDYTFKDVYPQDKVVFKKNFLHDNKIQTVQLNLKNNESAGTQKMFDLAGLVLKAFNLTEPGFIILDEIDSNFHPSLLIQLINLFNNPEFNRSNTQLLFTSHDTNLMSPKIMRRDQFFFTEKKEDYSTRVYSLSELKGIRNDADFAKQYLSGYYGALPILENYCYNNEKLLENE
jgi:AAA15 family ATPase/GTPase